MSRLYCGKLLAMREEDFVLAARLSGCSHTRIVGHHMLPSFMSYLIVDLTISFPYMSDRVVKVKLSKSQIKHAHFHPSIVTPKA